MADHKNRYERHQDTMSYLWLLTFGIQDTLSYKVLKKSATLDNKINTLTKVPTKDRN